MVWAVSRAAAENVTGELTVAPAVGEQIFTVLSTVAVQAAAASFAKSREKKKSRVAAENARRDIKPGPLKVKF
jgi:hypothetical protein